MERILDVRWRRRLNPLVVLAIGTLLSGCGRLPGNFDSLALEAQVVAYERQFEGALIPGPVSRARSRISSHVWPAADLMAKYIRGERHGLPLEEAIVIASFVQWRGCSLRGSAVHLALLDLVAKDSLSASEETAARVALAAIEESLEARDGLDDLGGSDTFVVRCGRQE